ncbi:MAG: trypsin-like peptidase domain-containing protein [Phycisphaerales bacterium]
MLIRPLVCAASLLLLAGAASAAPSAPAAPALAADHHADNEFARLADEKGPAIVTLKFVLKIEFNGNAQEREEEVTGVLIDAKGLVLCTNQSMGGFPPAMAKRMGNVSIVPTKIKVLVGDDTEGVDGKLIARDSDLDLAWVQVETPPAKPYTFIDFASSSTAGLGDELMILDRLTKVFDRALMVSDMRVGAVVKRPRPMIHAAGILNRYGVPVFNADRKAVGFAAFYTPAEEDETEGEESRPSLIVVPASEVTAATERARRTAEAGGAEPAPAAPAAPADAKPADAPADKK